MKLGYEKPEEVIKNLNEGAKNSKSSFCSCHTDNSGLELKCHQIFFNSVKFLETVTKFWDINHQFVT
jgi:hypothetical protein